MTVPPVLSAVWPLDVAIAAAIEAEHVRAGAPLADLLDSPAVYSGEARGPDGDLLPIASAYIVLGGSAEGTASGAVFRRTKRENTLAIDVWTADTSKRTALLVFGELVRILNRQDLPLAGYGTVRGSLELVASMVDPGRAAYHAVGRYRMLSFPPAAP